MALLAVAGQILASAVLDPLLERSITVAVDELRLVRGVPEEVEKLRFTVNIIRGVLKDAEKRSVGETPVGEWVQGLKQLLFDADDLLDEFATNAALQSADTKVRPMKFSCFSCIRGTMTDSAIAHQIRKIYKRLDHLASVKDKLGLQVSVAKENSRLEPMRDPTSSLLADTHSVIGRDKEREKIVELLLSSVSEAVSDSSRRFSVLPIVGMGGMGKTTLARLVFNDKVVVEHFELRIWVCVSNDFNLTRLTKDMIEGAYASGGKKGEYSITQWDVMQQDLRNEVEGRTFLLVLDDVWEANWSQWEKLFEPLNLANRGSKIVITTRHRDVIDKIQGRMPPISLERLSDAEIWSLFKRDAFNRVDGTINAAHSHLEAIGRDIVGRLKGSPLAARTIANLLRDKLEREHWEGILNSEMWRLEHEPDDILPTLGLSYQYLPGYLKQCFAYFSLFPKDYRFDQQELVQLWNAQCFISMESGTSIETTGSRYINNLLQRSFLDPAPSSFVSPHPWVMHDSSFVSPHPCVMHDLMHDLAEYVSKDDCLRLEDKECTDLIPASVRHISLFVTKFDAERLKELCKHEKLRTLLFFTRNNFIGLTTHDLDELFLKLKRLRILGLSDCGIKELPSSIGEMKHLRYIDLSHNPLQNLPQSLSNLRNLQVLNLSDTCIALPSRMSELINLRHLHAHESLVSKISGLGKLTALQELDVEGRKVKELGGLGMLRKLNIWNMEDVRKEDAMEARLENKEYLQELRLWWTLGRDGIDHEMEEGALQALRPADTITDLSIHGYRGTKLWWVSDDDAAGRTPLAFSCLRSLDIQHCPKLSELSSLPPTLTSLVLDRVDLTSLPGLRGCSHDTGGDGGETSSCSSSAAAALSQLCIIDCPKLNSLSGLLRHHLIVLERLTIRHCKELVSLPGMGFGHLVSLKNLEIFDCDKLTCPSLEDAEDVPLPLPLPRTLQALLIGRCGDAMGGWWWAGLRHLTSLTRLTLGGCPNTVASFFLSLGRHHNHHLAATLTNLRILNCPFEDGSSSPFASSSSRPAALPPPPMEDGIKVGFRALTSLKHLDLRGSLSVLRKWGLGGLPSSLRSLTVGGDDDLNDECLFECLQNLTEDLSIVDATNLCSLPSIFGCVTFLQSLTISVCRDLQSLPDMACLQLKKLSIKFCDNLLSLPASLSILCSLEELDIGWCAQIESMPEAGLPASLRRLKITECPSLAARCRDQECPDWPKIRHIPDVRIDYKSISTFS